VVAVLVVGVFVPVAEKSFPVVRLVSEKATAVPVAVVEVTVKSLLDVSQPNPDDSEVMELEPLKNAICPHVITLLLTSTHNADPVPGVSPARFKNESLSVVILMSPVPNGAKAIDPVPERMLTAEAPVVFPIVTVLAFDPVPKFTLPVVPLSKVIADEVVEVIVPAPAKVRAVAEVAIVSIEATPVSAPPVVTLRPPVLVRANVPLELPIATLPVFVVPRLRAPDPFGAMVIPALPDGVLIVAAEPLPSETVVPLTVKLLAIVSAPAAVTVQLVPLT
jgi:hypothetical protein